MEANSGVAGAIANNSKLMIKGLVIVVLVLLLLVPAHFVENLILEREERQKEAVEEVSSKWAGKQNITGPIVVLPYWENSMDTARKNLPVKRYAYFLPDNLEINSVLTPVKKHRGIYTVMLYNAETTLSGNFKEISPAILNINEADIVWKEAFVKMHLSDSRGLNSEPYIKWKDTILSLSPQAAGDNEMQYSLSAGLPVTSLNDLKECRFSSVLNLKGSEKILFSPVGKSTVLSIRSAWPHPSFTGKLLPDSSIVNKDGFEANWKSLSHTRSFPQQWKDNMYRIGDYFPDGRADRVDRTADTGSSYVTAASFGVDLYVPVSGYQKTMRTVKYAVLCILLTFAAFFLIETVNKKSVHPLQYALIGFALILFYTLLLSFSEYTGFNTAYGIAALATVGLITWFVKGLLGSMKLSLLLSVVLLLLYSYVFTILQLQDYALLLGSIGLFLSLAVVMWFSRKIQW